jgi:hypothetical protein
MLSSRIVKLALTIVVAALIGFADNADAQTPNANAGGGIRGASMDIPVASMDDLQIKSIMDAALQDQAILQGIMIDTKNEIMVRQAKAVPLRLEIGDAVSKIVSDRVRKEVREATRPRQMGAMQDASNPDGIPILIAPSFQ